MPDLKTVLAPNPACPVREVGDGFVIMAAEGETTHSLDGLGGFIWKRLDGRRDLAAVLAEIVAEYDVAADVAQTDLLEFAAALVAAGIAVEG
ncbi:MAG: PqqD family protein [Candidatus Krumholzibacteriia bacterium]